MHRVGSRLYPTPMKRDPDAVIQEVVRSADRAIVAAGRVDRVVGVLRAADKELGRRLLREARAMGGVTERFTGARLQAYRAQVRHVLDRLEPRLLDHLGKESGLAAALSQRNALQVLRAMEDAFGGSAGAPLRIEQATRLDSLANTALGSLLSRHASSIERYGLHMVRRFEAELQLGLVLGETQGELVRRLTGASDYAAPGIFRRQAYWARRIVRTETAYAYNSVHQQAIIEQREQFDDMAKKILAVFDDRTAPDSYFVHGQIRDVGEEFEDGKGRRYQHPPGRPNDRETVVPWRKAWPETRTTKMRPPQEVAERNVGAIPQSRRPEPVARAEKRREMAARIRQMRQQQAELRMQARRLERMGK